MSEKKNFNPLMLLVGMVAGVVGGVLISDKKTRNKAKGALETAKGSSAVWTKTAVKKVKEVIADAKSLSVQPEIVKAKLKKKIAKK